MAFDAYDDYEQGERVQQWLRQNAMSIVVGIAIGLIAIFGWQQWGKHKAGREAQAASLYQQLQVAQATGRQTQADALTDQLKNDHAGSAYAVFAAAEQAGRQVQANQAARALGSLDWAQQHAGNAALKGLMQLRAAQVQLAMGKPADAIARLDALPKDTYRGLGAELRGDALVSMGRTEDARKAYQAALAALDQDAPQRAALQLKLDDLAVAGKQGA